MAESDCEQVKQIQAENEAIQKLEVQVEELRQKLDEKTIEIEEKAKEIDRVKAEKNVSMLRLKICCFLRNLLFPSFPILYFLIIMFCRNNSALLPG